jgi:hypothetical protein
MNTTSAEPKGLKGWLILPAIGLIIAPLRLGLNLLKDFWPIFRDGYWPVLTTPGTEAYHPLWKPLLTFEIVGNSLFILANLALLFFFFTRHWRFPTLYITMLALNVVFVVSDFFMGNAIPAVAASKDTQALKEMARTIIAAAIWTPYFLRSRRVKNTFVKPGSVGTWQSPAGVSQHKPAVPTGV